MLLILDLRHADKPAQDAHIVDRYLMLQMAFHIQERVLIGLSSHGLFLEKARALWLSFEPGTRWSFLVGADTMARILDPGFYGDAEKELDELFSLGSFIIFERPAMPGIKLPVRFPVVPSPKKMEEVSSSWVRTRRQRGLPWRKGLSTKVARFIESTGLYLPEPSPYEARRTKLEEILHFFYGQAS